MIQTSWDQFEGKITTNSCNIKCFDLFSRCSGRTCGPYNSQRSQRRRWTINAPPGTVVEVDLTQESSDDDTEVQVDAIHPAPSQQPLGPTSPPPPYVLAAASSSSYDRSFSPEGDAARGAGNNAVLKHWNICISEHESRKNFVWNIDCYFQVWNFAVLQRFLWVRLFHRT